MAITKRFPAPRRGGCTISGLSVAANKRLFGISGSLEFRFKPRRRLETVGGFGPPIVGLIISASPRPRYSHVVAAKLLSRIDHVGDFNSGSKYCLASS